MRKFEANDRVVDEAFSECFAFVGVLDGLFVANAGEADTLNDDADAFVIKVCHDYYVKCQ